MTSPDADHFLSTLAVSFLRDERIRDEITTLVLTALAGALPDALRSAIKPTYMTRPEAADYIGRSVRSLDGLRSSGKLAWTKRGGRVMIATADLDAYLDQGRVGAATQRRAS